MPVVIQMTNRNGSAADGMHGERAVRERAVEIHGGRR